jgi:dihydroflavonol-4-reductase
MILITGGTGIVGSRLIAELLKKGLQLRALKRENTDISAVTKILLAENINSSGLEWVIGDILDVDSLSDALKGVEQIYHCAALVSFLPSEKKRMMKVNVEGTANVVNMAIERGVKSLCFVSSVAAIGRDPEHSVIDEEIEWKNGKHNSAYALSKHLAEMEVWRGKAEGLQAIVVNPTIIIGPGNWGMSSTSLFTRVWEGLPFYTKGINGYIDVRDVVKAMILLTEKGVNGERFILNAEHWSYQEVLNEIAIALGKKKPFIYVNPFLSEFAWIYELLKSSVTGSKRLVTKETARTANQKYKYSNEKIKKVLGMEFIPLRKSISDTSSAFLKDKKA